MATGDGLARVSYLPGAFPPPSPDTPVDIEEATRGRSGFDKSELDQSELEKSELEKSDVATSESDSDSEQGRAPDSERSHRKEVRAENVSMHALTRRGMSRWELEKTLLSRELDPEIVSDELDRLEGVGLIDDAVLAETFVRTQHDRKGLGRGAITAELRRRHVDQEHIDAALEQVDDDDEQSRATELAVKRAGQLSSYDVETAKRRLHGFLSRKGYSSSVVRIAIDEALSPRSSGVRFR